MKIDKDNKKPLIQLFNGNNESMSTYIIEKIYLMFQEMDKITIRENIFKSLVGF